ncbi:MAG: deoxyribose-phosphate aldolase [Oscillospiraceae bacterium]|nr:deoxyribose-phosphate aldolase [Oscillospiraceae bacterium]
MDIEAIRKEVEKQVMQYFHADTVAAPYQGRVVGADVVAHLEHSLLSPDTTEAAIREGCGIARKYGVAAICVAPYYVSVAREELLGSTVAVGTAIGFPHGCMSQSAKMAELRECMASGAQEIDVAINVLAVKSGRLDLAMRELEELLRASLGKAKLKAVFEHSLYSSEEKRAVLTMLRTSGVDFVKIQNMLSGHGARVEDVRLAHEILGRHVGIKIDGGIKTLAQAQQLLAAGATRLGLTATAKIAAEANGRSQSTFTL